MAENLFCVELGHGIPVVLLHGYPFDQTIWENVGAKISNYAHVLMPDLRGHGRSPKPASGYMVADMASDISRLLDEKDLSQAILVGHSMGGYVALSFAQQFPNRIIGLALVASHPYADDYEKKQSRMQTIEAIKSVGVVEALADMPEKLTRYPVIQKKCKGYIENTDGNGIIGVLNAIANRSDASGVLRNIHCPTTILAGKDDLIIPIEISRKMAVEFGNVIFKEIEGAGHLPMLEVPNKIAESLITMVKEIEGDK